MESIKRPASQHRQQFRSDANKLNYLCKAVTGFKWATVPSGNVITAQYTFNVFVAAPRKHFQLPDEANLSEISPVNMNRTVVKTLCQRYGRNPEFVRKQERVAQRALNNKPGELIFEECCRKTLCIVCGQKWSLGHPCRPEVTRNFVRIRSRTGDFAILLVSDVRMKLEEDESHRKKQQSTSDEDREHLGNGFKLWRLRKDLAAFEHLKKYETNDTHLVEYAYRGLFRIISLLRLVNRIKVLLTSALSIFEQAAVHNILSQSPYQVE